MQKRLYWLAILGAVLLLAAVPLNQARAGEVEKKEPATILEPVGLVGTVVAVTPESRTLVVDVRWPRTSSGSGRR